jgi:DNA topoisomerase-2
MHQQLDFKEHAKKRALWGGSAVSSPHEIWWWEKVLGRFQKRICSYGEALLNCADEIIVNTMDHWARSAEAPLSIGGPVRNIRISIRSGMIEIENDGPGMPVTREWKGRTKDIWMPQAIISEERMGSNFDDEGDRDRITGGLNGLGIKVANVACREFGVETTCLVNRKYYRQVCRERMDIIEPPTVIDLPRNSAETRACKLTSGQLTAHTKIWMLPYYDLLSKKDKETEWTGWYEENVELVENLLRMRAYQIAALSMSVKYKTVAGRRVEYVPPNVWFQGQKLTVDLEGLMKMFGLTRRVMIELSGPEIQNPWVIGLGFISDMDRGKVKAKEVEQMSIINGIHVTDGGSHVNMMIRKICDALTVRAKAEVTEGIFKKIFCYFDCKQFPFRELDFKSQTKQKITIGAGDQNRMKALYQISDDTIDKIWEMSKKEIKNALDRKAIADQTKTIHRGGPIRKFDPPDQRGPDSGLFCAEGDTALQTVRNMIKMKESPLDKKKYGTYSLQGVPPNALKMIKIIPGDSGQPPMIKIDPQLINNITFQGLMRAVGLDFNCKYELGSVGDREFSKLNCGFIVEATDQDLDGIGHICSLVAVFIACFWPALFKRRFVRRLATPIVRVYCPDGTVEEFYSEDDFETWADTKWGEVESPPTGYEVKYYKGIGSHTKEEVHNMGLNILDNIFVLTWDDLSESLMHAMYGEDTTQRKIMLTTPVVDKYPDEVWETRCIPLSVHFRVESKEFQLMNMRRKLRSCIDGLIPTQRKALCGGRKMFNSGLKSAKVFQVGAYVAKAMHYGQGDSSMNGVIMKMAQSFEGACNMPVFVPISTGFGDNVEGRSETGGARYLDTQYNKKIMDIVYPRDDDWLLEYVREDRTKCEPKYYVPIVPMSILESENTTGTGWKIDLCGRDFEWTINQIRRRIGGYDALSLFGRPWMKSPGLTTRMENGREVSYGDYKYYPDESMIHITQLPYRVWSYPWKCYLMGIDPITGKDERRDPETNEMYKLQKKPYIKKINDDTNNGVNDIKVWLEPGGYEHIVEDYGTPLTDPIEQFLELRHILITNINMIDETNYVHEFKDYNAVFEHWFPIRRNLYIARLERSRLILEYRIQYYKEVLRYIIMDSTKQINIDKDFEDEARDLILSEAGFTRFNKAVLLSPGFLRADQLHNAIFMRDASYKYVSDISIGEKSKKEIAKLEKKILDLEDELLALNNSTWESLWLEELDRLVAMLKLGLETGWMYDHKKFKFVNSKRKKKTIKK